LQDRLRASKWLPWRRIGDSVMGALAYPALRG
jgi:hypothetical protein